MLEIPGWVCEGYCLQCSLMDRYWWWDRGQGSWVFWGPGDLESTSYCGNASLGMTSQTMGSYPHWLYAGPFLGKMILIVVNAHSKWMEVEIVPAPTSAHTVEKVRAMFTTHGLPELLVSDNGTAFTSAEFQEFLSFNGVRHLTSAPYHLSSNGLAERAYKLSSPTCRRAQKRICRSSSRGSHPTTDPPLIPPQVYCLQRCWWVITCVHT